MPIHLKIVIALIFLNILSQIFSVYISSDIAVPSSYAYEVLSIAISAIIIKGFFGRSRISRHFAIGLTIFGLIFAAASIYTIYNLQLPEGNIEIEYFVVFLVIIIELYILFALFTKKVVEYFR